MTITQPDDELEIQEEIEPDESQIMNHQQNPTSSRAQQNVPTYQSLRSPNAFETTDRERSMGLKIAELEEEKN